MTRPARVVREAFLATGAALGVLCVLGTLAAVAFGVTPLVFRSGSMSPTIPTGSLALATEVPATDIGVGDVVSLHADGSRISHRVTSAEVLGEGRVALTLRGDANNVADPAPYVVEKVDRIFFHVDRVGYAVSWLTSPSGVVVCAGFVALTLVLGLRRGPRVSDDLPGS